MVTHESFQELISIYALGALPAAERKQLIAHLKECAPCRKQLRQERAIVQMIPRSVESVEPSRETKLKLFARVDADLAQENARARKPVRAATQPPRRNWFSQLVFAFAVIAALALLTIGAWILSAEQRAIASIVNDPNAQKIALAGTKDAPNASAEMIMVPGHSQAVLKVSGLNPLPPDKGYEFWFFRGGVPQPSNVFTVNADGTMIVLVQANDKVENFKGWGVTIEPRAGVTQPTGPIVILGGL